MGLTHTGHTGISFMPLLYHSEVGFPTGRDSTTFRDSGTGKNFLSRDKGTTGQKFFHCPGTKGQWDNLKILPRDGPSQDSQNSGRDGTGRDSQKPGRDTGQNGTEQKRTF